MRECGRGLQQPERIWNKGQILEIFQREGGVYIMTDEEWREIHILQAGTNLHTLLYHIKNFNDFLGEKNLSSADLDICGSDMLILKNFFESVNVCCEGGDLF